MIHSARRRSDDEVVHYEPPRKSRGVRKTNMQPPLTPMIDVTFQLLLFFLIACQFRQDEGQIPGSLPDTGEGVVVRDPVELKELRIELRPNASEVEGRKVTYFIGGPRGLGAADPETLFTKLKQHQEQFGGSTDMPVIIEPLDKVPWLYVVEAFNQCIRAKFKKIGFASRM